MRILSNDNVALVIDRLSPETIKQQALTLLKELNAFHHNPQSIAQPPRLRVTLPVSAPNYTSQKTTLYMPTLAPTNSSLKVVTISSNSSPSSSTSHPPPRIPNVPEASAGPKGSLFLFSSTGELESILNAHCLTAYRTALASLIPFLLRHGILQTFQATPGTLHGRLNITIFGAGLIAEYTAKLLIKLFPHAKSIDIHIFNRTLKNRESLLSRMPKDAQGAQTKIKISYRQHTSLQTPKEEVIAALNQADAIFCCTPSLEPLFPSKILLQRASRHENNNYYISLIGSYTPQMKEVDSVLLSGKDTMIIVDSKEACTEEAGEIILYKAQQNVNPLDMFELGELYEITEQCNTGPKFFLDANRKVQAQTMCERVKNSKLIYKSVGFGLLDMVIGKELLKEAEMLGFGSVVEGF